MKRCSYCGRENQEEAVYCRECGMTEWVVPVAKAAASLEKPEVQAESLGMKPESELSAEGEVALCTYCIYPNSPEAAWCKGCGASLSFVSIVGPLDAARASGFMWRGIVRGRPKRFVLFSVWGLFLPKLLLNLFVAFALLMGGARGIVGVAQLWLSLAFAAVAFSMIYQVTKNYVTVPEPQLE